MIGAVPPGRRRMTRYIAFLRAINVGGHTVRMEDLRALFTSLSFASVKTFIASGNVAFTAVSGSEASLQAKIERRLREALGYEVATFLRTDAEVAEVASYRPFPEPILASAAALNVGFLAKPLSAEAARILGRFETEIDTFHLHGRELIWLCRKKQSESTFSNVALERALGIRATFRGMNTVRKLAERYPPLVTAAPPPPRKKGG